MTSIMGIRYVVCFNSRWLGGWLVTSIMGISMFYALTVAG